MSGGGRAGVVRGRHIGGFGATMIGVGAMLGAGILVLSGAALRAAGPGAMVAFLLNGIAALVTAASFAELAGTFPEPGGGYTYAKKVLPIGGGFAAGWVLWFAYAVACALYALGFAGFVAYGLERFGVVCGGVARIVIALAVIGYFGRELTTRGAQAGNVVSALKLLVFLGLIALGLAELIECPAGELAERLTPVFPYGFSGVLAAMGLTFITLEGFEVIAAVSDEVRDPERTIPRAMFASIGLTLLVYLGLLFVMLTVGGKGAEEPAWIELGRRGSDAVVVAVRRFAGPIGEAVVTVAALFATFTALGAALLGASRGAFAMARDRALPRLLARVHGEQPVVSIWASASIAAAVVLGTGSVEVAGASASLIFLLSFALANATGLLVRVRVGAPLGFRAPWYPLLPVLGLLFCAGMAVYQAWRVPAAAAVAGAWLAVGGGLYLFWFRRAAQAVRAHDEALDVRLIRLQGREPLVLVPIANPERAQGLISLAHALAVPGLGRVQTISVVADALEKGADGRDVHVLAAYDRLAPALRGAIEASARLGVRFEGVLRLERDVPAAIGAAVAERRPEVVLLGMSRLEQAAAFEGEGDGAGLIDALIEHTRADIAVLQAPSGWRLDERVREVIVPIGGRLAADRLRARVLGTLRRDAERRITLVRVVQPGDDLERARAVLWREAEDLGLPPARAELIEAEQVIETLLSRAEGADLMVIGLGVAKGRRALISPFVRELARRSPCPLLAIAGARPASTPGPWRLTRPARILDVHRA